jgi:hypothetical protein
VNNVIEDIFTDDTLQDEQFFEDFSSVHEALSQRVARFGKSTLDPTGFDGKQIDKHILQEIKKHGRIHNGFVPKKIREKVLNRGYCIPVTGLKDRYWLFFHPTLNENKNSSCITMDHQRIQTLSTQKGRYHLALLQPGRIFMIKSHCVHRLLERAEPKITETEAMTALMDIAYDLNVKLVSGYQDFDVPRIGGKVKARVGVADVKVQEQEKDEDNIHYIVICYTYYPPHFES